MIILNIPLKFQFILLVIILKIIYFYLVLQIQEPKAHVGDKVWNSIQTRLKRLPFTNSKSHIKSFFYQNKSIRLFN